MLEVNLLGVIAATLVGMLLGALWYSSIAFGGAWMKCVGKTPETLGKQTAPLVGSIISSLLTAVGVSLLFSLLNVSNFVTAISIGAILGFLVIFPALLSDNLFCGWGSKLLIIQSGYRVVSVFLMSLVIYLV
ncbi:DUF1761 domain-containing protein [Neptunomonas japonica]|uniref:DUF1761 domain-containing protein n=1 Tax=Neptunomonas japonica TaxID=417574 RepID=UPI0003F5CFBD|nr:DUF1761 domain-containing protein [Neptunomonas japonica]